ncbi:hypothetical protein G6026_11640 [Dietzia sp. DQ11-38-2]|uniref:hypothetical protein n=1 Tax=Dietzia sp. DQ11-38-2 TaxID=2711155 RepID=UPI0015F8F692|nr:hypothetical protein [Dietzia sp. DQ11-38-2]MBB1028322.1 hypothetical protein [Dietzia sp. DQ11-38-2]
MDIQITAAHWCYLIGIVVILVTMMARKNIVVPAVVATLVTATVYTMDPLAGLASIFLGSLVAAGELFNIFLVIAFITAMLGAMKAIGADTLMIKPFRRVIKGPTSSFLVIAVVTYVISLFFWPTPAVPLVGAVLIPVAIRSGLPPLTAGVIIALAGQGMALSSDYIIKVAPGLSATAAGVGVDEVADKAMVMSLIVGITAMVITYFTSRRSFRRPSPELLDAWERGVDLPLGGGSGRSKVPSESRMRAKALSAFVGRAVSRPQPQPQPQPVVAATAQDPVSGSTVMTLTDSEPGPDQAIAYREDVIEQAPSSRKARAFAVLVPLAYTAFIGYLLIAKFTAVPDLEGGDAAAIVGGIAVIMTYLICATDTTKAGFFETCAEHIIEGLVFAFRAMGIVIPIAGFFFLGNGEFAGRILGLGEGETAPTLLFDMVTAAQSGIPENAFFAGFSVLLIGLVAGLDGSGFSGLPLTGSLAGGLAPAVGMDPATLAAIGQMGNIWAGGGTLVAWSSLVAVAGVTRTSAVDLARKCFVPVMAGLTLSTTIAILIF